MRGLTRTGFPSLPLPEPLHVSVVSDGRKRADAHHAAIAGFVDRIELRVEGVKEFALGILRIAVLARADPVR